MPQHRLRTDAPALPQPRERVFDDENRGLRELCAVEECEFLGCPVVSRSRGEHIEQCLLERGPEQTAAALDLLAESTLPPIDLAGHEGVLRSLSGKEERDRRRPPIADGRRMPLRGSFRQARDRVRDAFADESAAAGKALAADLQRVRDLSEVGSWVLCEVPRQAPRPRLERGGRLGREHQKLTRAAGHGGGLRRGRLLEHDVSVRAPDTKCADPRSPYAIGLFPVREVRVDEEGAVLEINLRIGALEM